MAPVALTNAIKNIVRKKTDVMKKDYSNTDRYEDYYERGLGGKGEDYLFKTGVGVGKRGLVNGIFRTEN
jgi:hypothetical protein